jgi:RNA polymerase sigma factor (sigma-70 family)
MTNDNDRDLLARFVDENNGDAFAELARRHQRMVMSVCKRMLGDCPDAGDSAQAVFLLLAEKASSLRGRDSLAGFLHHAARNISNHCRRSNARRAKNEKEAAEIMHDDSGQCSANEWKQLRDNVDKALDAMPEKLRNPVVLHYMEGCTQAEIAEQLGVSPGTVASRLSRGRERLQNELKAAGAVFGLAAIASFLQKDLAAVSIPTNFATTCAQTALVVKNTGLAGAKSVVSAKTIKIIQGALRTMKVARLKTLAIVTAAAVVVIGAPTAYVVLAGDNSAKPGLTGEGTDYPLDGKGGDVAAEPEMGIDKSTPKTGIIDKATPGIADRKSNVFGDGTDFPLDGKGGDVAAEPEMGIDKSSPKSDAVLTLIRKLAAGDPAQKRLGISLDNSRTAFLAASFSKDAVDVYGTSVHQACEAYMNSMSADAAAKEKSGDHAAADEMRGTMNSLLPYFDGVKAYFHGMHEEGVR